MAAPPGQYPVTPNGVSGLPEVVDVGSDEEYVIDPTRLPLIVDTPPELAEDRAESVASSAVTNRTTQSSASRLARYQVEMSEMRARLELVEE